MILLKLALEFFKTGLFAIGGGLATLPFLMDMSSKYNWFTMEELTNMIAISESTPGPIGVNMSTYAGFNSSGILGAITATLALTLPSFIIILIISSFLKRFRENKYVDNAFYGIRPAVSGLLIVVMISLIKVAITSEGASPDSSGMLMLESGRIISITAVIIIACSYVLMQAKPLKKLHPLVWIGVGAILGIVFKL